MSDDAKPLSIEIHARFVRQLRDRVQAELLNVPPMRVYHGRKDPVSHAVADPPPV